jgi:hypothetical protein
MYALPRKNKKETKNPPSLHRAADSATKSACFDGVILRGWIN